VPGVMRYYMQVAQNLYCRLTQLGIDHLAWDDVERYQQVQKMIRNRKNLFFPVRWKRFSISSSGECEIVVPKFALDLVIDLVKWSSRFNYFVERANNARTPGDSFLCAEYDCVKFYLCAWDQFGKEAKGYAIAGPPRLIT